MSSPLSPVDLQALQAIQAQLRASDALGAVDRFDALPVHVRDHPNGLFLRALLLQAFGRLPDARQSYEAALELAPDHPGLWLSYGNLLDDMGEGDKAVEALQRATALRPDHNDGWIDLGIAATAAGRFEVAEAALARAIRAAPAVARGWAALGLLERQRGNTDTAAQLYRRAIDLDAGDVRSRHNLATLLREEDRPQEALEEAEEALRHGPAPPETATLRAHLLADVGRHEEAVAGYRDILARIPEHLDAHESLALLLPQLGFGAQALDGYRAALRARPGSVALWGSALRSAFAIHDYVQLAAWGQEAEALVGPRPDVRIARAAALSRMGNHDRAIALLRELLDAAPDHARVHQHLAHCLIAAGDPKAAEAHALRATELDPTDQAPWALLTVIWRLLDDSREAWLADYERLVMPVDLDAAPGFFDELADRLNAMHVMRDHPAEQSLRGGTQTRGNLFDRRDPLIRRLVAQVHSAVERRLRELPDDPTHPFLSRKADAIDFGGSWSVRLRSDGFHINHIHQFGWMSSALYVSLPPEVCDGEAGALAFGIPDAALGLNLPARRVETPQVGRLIVFPSYFWHGTAPFESAQPRLTIAFDALPKN
ncbi:tetratricopeptide repeat protein [Sphingomonas sp. MAH-20]|uniref:Tetratricopeptide repeat protein n=1 Tax=Sphingomonas horti TaxID=2682842 RepID=A0A6I4IWM3_9SPHN|nr:MULTISPECIES: tetratricopeptide repeat protein [Sphingomonas]MBA2920113.1 tetratricopeptide repeat protein [Sphingomonas sp. CGMCC 1.13658]MVO76368.1 tetratricopeptide repeat protein [Sphingomonas horti]